MAATERGQPGTWQQLAMWRDGALDLDATRAHAPANDLHAARLLHTVLYPGLLHFVPAKSGGTWYVWDGRCHRPDESARIGRLLQGFAALYETALQHIRREFDVWVAAQNPQATEPDLAAIAARQWKDDWGAVAGYAARLRNSAGLTGLRLVLGDLTGVTAEEMADRWPYHLNVANGILDLRTGQLHPHDPGAMMTYCLAASWNPAAACPKYARMLHRAVGGVDETYRCLVKALGYSLAGRNPFNKVFFLNGPPANGKTALLRVLSTVLGTLAHPAEPTLVARTRDARNAREENSIRGARAITISETSAGIHIDEAQIKRLTGEEEITTHQHYAVAKNRTAVTWLIIFATNEMPSILHLDAGMRRRIIVIPMGPSIPEAEWNDALVGQICAEELDGVLALLAWGCRAALAEGFAEAALPTGVLAETAQYIADQDTIEVWLADRAQADFAPSANGERPREQPALLWTSYHRYYGPQPHLNRTEFFTHLAGRHGIERSPDRRWFLGVQLHEDDWIR